ncbi:MAG: lipid-A-disaccharide synthase, partial [Ignavibacteriae bacterium]|nr:lipid-A-disaccharide synthase [Ignavibacteriota bacterium]
DIYRQEGMDVEFVGHPLAEKIGSSMERSEFFQRHGWDIDLKLLALFPGSRKQEVENILPTMVEAASKLRTSHKLQIAVGVAPNLGVDLLRSYIADREGIVIVQNSTYDLMHHADAAIVTSGTATLETGWFATPMVMVYKTSPVTFAIGRMLVGVPYIGLVNIVAGKKVVPELIQHDLTPDKLCKEVKRLIEDDEYARLMRSELSVIKSKLGGPGASAKVAEGIISLGEAA